MLAMSIVPPAPEKVTLSPSAKACVVTLLSEVQLVPVLHVPPVPKFQVRLAAKLETIKLIWLATLSERTNPLPATTGSVKLKFAFETVPLP